MKQLHSLGNVVSYLDAAHGGWLGWQNNLNAVMPIFKQVLDDAGGVDTIRGFVTNTANYQALGSTSSNADPCHLKSQYNFAVDEAHYIQLFDRAAQSAGLTGMRYITDTSRNGVTEERGDCANWCNIDGSGLGRRPSTDVADIGLSDILDAVVWVKTPGESDGTTDQSGRYDPKCVSADSKKPAPEAGQWYEDFYVMLVKNAVPAIN